MDYHTLRRALLLGTMLLLAVAPPALAHMDETDDQQLQLMEMRTDNKLYVVGYAHLDTQWRWAYPKVIQDYIPATLYGNFRLFEQYPNYIFNFSGSRRYEMMREYYPQGYGQLKQYIAAGRWFPCGSSVDENDANVPDAESFIRQVLYGNHFFEREFGKSSSEFMLPDCFGFPGSMPGILAHCGLKGFSTQKLVWGSAVGVPFNVGVWEGLDGTSIIVAALNPGAYVGKVTEDLSQSKEWQERIEKNGAASGVFKDYHYFGTGDTGGAPGEESVQWIEKSAAGTGGVKVISSTAEQMFLDLTPDDIAGLPRFRGDMLLTQHSAGSITSQAYMKRLNRQCELLADAAERAAVAAAALGGPAYPQAQLNKAWGLTLGSQMHDILPGTSLPVAYEYSWNDNFIALNQFADVLTTSAAAVASGMDTSTYHMLVPRVQVPVVIYNPTCWEREELVEMEIQTPEGKHWDWIEVTNQEGTLARSQTLSRTETSARLLIQAKVPPVSFNVYHVQAVDSKDGDTIYVAGDDYTKATESELNNAQFRVQLDANGDVSSIFDKTANRELLSAPHRLAFIEDSPGYWPAWNKDYDDQMSPPKGYVDGPATIRVVENGPVRATVEVTRQAKGSTFVQRISLCAGEAGRRVEFHNTIDWRSKSCSLKAVFPLTAKNDNATYNWGVGTLERPTNNEKQYEVPSHQWFDLTDASGEFGATVLCPFKYGSDKPDDHTLRLTLLRTPGPVINKEGQVAYDYADQCSQDWGRHEISYALAGHSGDWRSAGTDRMAYEFEQPLIAFQASAHPGPLGRSFSLASVDNPAVRISAIKKGEDGEHYIIRVVEMQGKEQKNVNLSLGVPTLASIELDGQERPLSEGIRSDQPVLSFDLAPYKLRTFMVHLGSLAKSTSPMPAPAEYKVVPLPYDSVVASSDGQMSIGGFDANGRSLPAEELHSLIQTAGIQFGIGLGGVKDRTGVACRGQQIDLPPGKYDALYLLAASSPSDQEVDFLIDGVPQHLRIQDWGGYVGQWDNRVWEGKTEDVMFEWKLPLVSLTPAYTRRDPVAWFCSHRHDGGGRNEPYEYCYLYRHRLNLPPGAKSLTLPDNPAVKIMAITAASVADPAFRPAQPLYDELSGHPAAEFGGWLPEKGSR